MIILLIVLFAIATYVSLVVVKPLSGRIIAGTISLLLLSGSVLILTMHISQNWGMKEVTTTTTKNIYTAGETSAPYGMMIKAEIGQGTNNYVLIYRTSANEKKPSVNFKPNASSIDKIVTAVKKSATYKLTDTTTAKAVTKTTRLTYSSAMTKALFDWGTENHRLVKQATVVEVPKDTWLVLTAGQVAKLQKLAPQMQAQAAADPAKAAQMQALAKSDPTAYAKLQVSAIKQALGIN
ncbi:hypothetical protein WOSG25_120310 [Weissella oryzae SG25]|uniref:DUF4811 domain-containing protein n=1 Tax=Weissella oryzae (strain DSM 25784 / JCM 18191 / LMG 30913 / SG25) TaxID=1329250 RepID=A0A069CVY9_WEIOS|nr:DUF4811 domain-containing protein [Weissella oryzae]GAK31639.1 hypothetical protein WOSG25_120310 [Weissella oryzae SG25]